MEKLISFLLSNIHFVIIAGFFLFSVLGKAAKGNTNQQPRMPQFGGGASEGHNKPNYSRGVPQAPRAREMPASVDDATTSYERYEPFEPPTVYTTKVKEEPAASVYTAPIVTEQPQARAGSNVSNRTSNRTKQKHVTKPVVERGPLTKQQLRQAIIWSEVLARPRSLPPRRKW